MEHIATANIVAIFLRTKLDLQKLQRIRITSWARLKADQILQLDMSRHKHSRSDQGSNSTTRGDERHQSSPLINFSGKNKLVFNNCGNVKLRYSSRNHRPVRDCASGGFATSSQILRHPLCFLLELRTDIRALRSSMQSPARSKQRGEEQVSTRRKSRVPERSLPEEKDQAPYHRSRRSKRKGERRGRSGKPPSRRDHALNASQQ
jgi:hypothetical protein